MTLIKLTTFVVQGVRSIRASYIIYPGNEIPKWFNFQSNGYCIELPQGSLNNIIGFALCTIFEFQDYGCDDLIVRYELRVRTDVGDNSYRWDSFPEEYCWAWNKGSGPNYIESDHVWLGFRFCNFQTNSKAMIIFQVRNHDLTKSCKIKKCGVHFFSQQSALKAVEESRSRRFFIYDDEEKQEESISKTLKFQNFINGESSSRCGVPPVNVKEVEQLESN
ncbi:hypothetical protein Pint_07091 [Pistacia integerrima]|uniref:Uncharacterized protein n=1 Tax=Pistacia integerrima TaxID=434235 RepID=A0ACC0XXU6_9ROSI|nr:hypothetical protein Pint_07091 [Pistacia integerrima]